MDKLTVGLEWLLNPDHILLILDTEKSWFKEESLEIKMIELEEHFDTLDRIENNSMGIATTEPIHLVRNRTKEQSVVGFARYLHTNGGIIYSKNKSIARPKDLIGRQLQYPDTLGPGGIAIAETVTEADGGTYKEGDITPASHSFYRTDALLTDKADAAALIFENFEILGARNQGLNVNYFPFRNYSVSDFCQLIFIIAPEVLNTSEIKLKKFLRVIQRAIHCINHRLGSTIEVYLTYTQTDISSRSNKDTIEITVKYFTNDLSMGSDCYNDLQLWPKEVNDIKDTINPTLYSTNQLLFSRYTK